VGWAGEWLGGVCGGGLGGGGGGWGGGGWVGGGGGGPVGGGLGWGVFGGRGCGRVVGGVGGLEWGRCLFSTGVEGGGGWGVAVVVGRRRCLGGGCAWVYSGGGGGVRVWGGLLVGGRGYWLGWAMGGGGGFATLGREVGGGGEMGVRCFFFEPCRLWLSPVVGVVTLFIWVFVVCFGAFCHFFVWGVAAWWGGGGVWASGGLVLRWAFCLRDRGVGRFVWTYFLFLPVSDFLFLFFFFRPQGGWWGSHCPAMSVFSSGWVGGVGRVLFAGGTVGLECVLQFLWREICFSI